MRKGGGSGDGKILPETLTKNSLTCRRWIQTISSKQFEKIGSMGILGLGVKMKAAEELRTCRAGKTFYTFHEAAATRRHTPQSLRLAIFLFLGFWKGHLEKLLVLYCHQ